MGSIAQCDTEAANIKIHQALAVLRAAIQEVYEVELAASDGTHTAVGERWLEYVCSVDLRDARIMLEAVSVGARAREMEDDLGTKVCAIVCKLRDI